MWIDSSRDVVDPFRPGFWTFIGCMRCTKFGIRVPEVQCTMVKDGLVEGVAVFAFAERTLAWP